ncbi:MAG: ABC transporter permease [Mucilaginibacter sp.]
MDTNSIYIDLILSAAIAAGLTLALLLAFAKHKDLAANRFLSLALMAIILWMIWALGIDIGLNAHIAHWSRLPAHFSLAAGPLIYFYVLKKTSPGYKFHWKNLLHFSPALLEQGAFIVGIRIRAVRFDTVNFMQMNLVVHGFAAISIIIYLCLSDKLVKRFQRRMRGNLKHKAKFGLLWLHRTLMGFSFLWLISISYIAINYLYYRHEPGVHSYCLLYLLSAMVLIRAGIAVFLKPEPEVQIVSPAISKPALSAELQQKATWLKKVVQDERLYLDPELTVSSLAEILEIPAYELSRIINLGIGKNFSDFISEYRIMEVTRKMKDKAFDRLTLLGIAYDSGFNSKSTFNRTFREMTGKTPAEFKDNLKKEFPISKLRPFSPRAAIISFHETVPQWSEKKFNRRNMFKNYLKIAIRQFRKQKMYAAIKIGGFAFSIAACLLIALYIRNELSYDKFYPDADRIYRVVLVYKDGNFTGKGPEWPAPLARTLKSNFPQIEYAGRLMPNTLMGAGNAQVRPAGKTDNSYEEGVTFADQSILNLFQFPMVYGDRAHALTSPNTVVITRKKAERYFPGQNPVGKQIYFNNDTKRPFTIGGVIENLPANSHLSYDFWVTLTGQEFWQGEQNNWGAFNYPTYVRLKPGVDAKAFEKKITADMVKNYFAPSIRKGGTKDAEQRAAKYHMVLQQVKDINLYSYDIKDGLQHGDIRFLWLFGGVAAFILVIACINFVNLATAKSANRAKEVGLRKVVGSDRSGLIRQFLIESLLYSSISFIIGLLLACLLLPYFNMLASKTLTMPWGEWWLLPVILLSAFIVGIVAGLYPAFYLSAFRPVQVLKGTLSTGSKSPVLRNSLVVFQFTASIMLIIGTLVVNNQMHYILNQKIGFNKDQVIIVQGTNTLSDTNVVSFKNELLKLATVKSASISDYLPVYAGTKRNGNDFNIEGREKLDAAVNGELWQIDDTYLKTLGMKLVEGRNFSYDRSDDVKGKTVIINQTMAKRLNLKSPVGVRITEGDAATIIGVVEDFNFDSMHEGIKPLVLHFGLSPSMVSVKVQGGNMKSALQAITATWKQFAPNQPIRYTFLDESFAAMYADVQRMGDIFTTFAILAVIIACLGLFALSAFMAEQRSKEIGIRKVLGASVSGITRLLSFDFVKLVLVAILIASPIAWWGMHEWLQGFVYHPPVQWWIFIAAGLVAILIALITISFQSIKAAIANPAKSLRSE